MRLAWEQDARGRYRDGPATGYGYGHDTPAGDSGDPLRRRGYRSDVEVSNHTHAGHRYADVDDDVDDEYNDFAGDDDGDSDVYDDGTSSPHSSSALSDDDSCSSDGRDHGVGHRHHGRAGTRHAGRRLSSSGYGGQRGVGQQQQQQQQPPHLHRHHTAPLGLGGIANKHYRSASHHTHDTHVRPYHSSAAPPRHPVLKAKKLLVNGVAGAASAADAALAAKRKRLQARTSGNNAASPPSPSCGRVKVPSASSSNNNATGQAGTSAAAAAAAAAAPANNNILRTFSSTYYGVSWHKSSQRWAVQIRHDGKRIHVGYYSDEVTAAKAYDEVRWPSPG